MPLPERLARFNRRVTNPVTRLFAGRLPLFAIVVHRGRVSGREYRTPVNAFGGDGAIAIALTYGAETDWVKNVLAAGGCTLIRRGRRFPTHNPRLVGEQDGLSKIPRSIRLILGLLAVTEFLLLDPDVGGRADDG